MCVGQIQSLPVRVINAVSVLFAKVGLVILVAMMLLTVAEVLLRYVFNRPILGSTEVIQFMMVTLAFLVLVWCTMRRGHVKVEVVARHFPLKVQAICDTVFSLFSLALYSFMALRTCMPSIPGSQMSRKMMSGFWETTRSMTSSPS